MSSTRTKLGQTQEILAWKISLSKIGSAGEGPKKGSVIGWEYASPEKGYPYLVYLHDGAVFRSSPVQELREVEKGAIIKTLNSVYYVEYLDMEYIPDKAGRSIVTDAAFRGG
jgi:hypothetical protein